MAKPAASGHREHDAAGDRGRAVEDPLSRRGGVAVESALVPPHRVLIAVVL